MKTTLNIEPRKVKRTVKIDRALLNKYSHLSRFEGEPATADETEEIEVEHFELLDKDLQRTIEIFDESKFTKEEQIKFDTLFYMVYKYRTEDFRNRVARHEQDLSFGFETERVEQHYSEEAKINIENLLKLLKIRDTGYANLSVIFKINDVKRKSGKGKNLINSAKNVEFTDTSTAKYISYKAITNFMQLLSYSNNKYVDGFFYFCRNADTITVEEIESELSKITTNQRSRGKMPEQSRFRNYQSFLINVIQQYTYDERLTICNKQINVGTLRLLCYHLLAKFGFISTDKLSNNKIAEETLEVNKDQIGDFIRNLSPSAITHEGKLEHVTDWDIIDYLQKSCSVSELNERYPDFVTNFNEFHRCIKSPLRVSLNDSNETIIKAEM
ncbi:hypothetical protein [Sphingobacterium paludis]|nr:hypothetical protein [Sphingobacterium paludis]